MQVWGSRLRILLNNYSNKDPFSPKLRDASGLCMLVQSVSVATQQLKHSEARPQKRPKKGMPSGATAEESPAIERLSAFHSSSLVPSPTTSSRDTRSTAADMICEN